MDSVGASVVVVALEVVEVAASTLFSLLWATNGLSIGALDILTLHEAKRTLTFAFLSLYGLLRFDGF